MRLQEYVDADWAGSAVDRKSTSSCCFTLGSAMVSWCSKKQSSVALSTTEAKYIALSVAFREAVWLRKLLTDLFVLNLYAAARGILLEDGQDPRCVLGPLDVFQRILA
jgi:hypothetical protein